jgi:putative oxidoreductase
MLRNVLRLLDALQPLALLALRVTLGVIMVAHGWPKVTGGVSGLMQRVESWGWPGWLAYLTMITEFFGGGLLIVGFLMRPVAVAVLINMQVAMWKVHVPQGFLGAGGYEFTLMLSVVAFALIILGPGKFSADYLLFGDGGRKLRSPG